MTPYLYFIIRELESHKPHGTVNKKFLIKFKKKDVSHWEQGFGLIHCSSSAPRKGILVVQSPSHVWLFATTWTTTSQASLFLTISWSLPKFMSIASVMPSSHLILWHPLLVLPSIFASIRDFSKESTVHIRWPKYWILPGDSERYLALDKCLLSKNISMVCRRLLTVPLLLFLLLIYLKNPRFLAR